MSIFSNPSIDTKANPDEVYPKVLFLHGLEGSVSGSKAVHLKQKWSASVPPLRTHFLVDLRSRYPGKEWCDLPKKEFEKALNIVYDDAVSAMMYYKPDIVIGSSMGGALLAKMILEKTWQGPSIFLAPAISLLLKGSIQLPENKSAVWILGEADEVVSNDDNIRLCKTSGGNLIVSAGDGHRLQGALSSGMIDSAIVTVLEIENLV